MLINIVKVHSHFDLTQWCAKNELNDMFIIQYKHGLLTVEKYAQEECENHSTSNWNLIYRKRISDDYNDNEMSTYEMKKILIEDRLMNFGKIKNLWYKFAWKLFHD
jgi:hypothetical protein